MKSLFVQGMQGTDHGKETKNISQNIFPLLEDTHSLPVHYPLPQESPSNSPSAPQEEKNESKKLSVMFLVHEISKDTTTKLEWKSSFDSFGFGIFELVDPSSSCNLKIEVGMDEIDDLRNNRVAHKDSSAVNRHRLEVLSGVNSVLAMEKSDSKRNQTTFLVAIANVEDAPDNASSSFDVEDDLSTSHQLLTSVASLTPSSAAHIDCLTHIGCLTAHAGGRNQMQNLDLSGYGQMQKFFEKEIHYGFSTTFSLKILLELPPLTNSSSFASQLLFYLYNP
ncbi:UDP-N-acetylmuramoyl-L-alanyl-D-glutamate--2, 6-diaminopimelate [Sesbania bispinosa]|nr:UDP-N-acetylmuramoyl-L-alanyl-D-glutamate--2, 6-diaminopimelate [Sesbania bispinosa]